MVDLEYKEIKLYHDYGDVLDKKANRAFFMGYSVTQNKEGLHQFWQQRLNLYRMKNKLGLELQ
jgi:hypothetical protein